MTANICYPPDVIKPNFIIQSSEKRKFIPNIFYVERDDGDTVARKFADKNDELLKYLKSDEIYDKEKREKNLAVYRQKEKAKKSYLNKLKNKLSAPLSGKIKKPYIHKNRI